MPAMSLWDVPPMDIRPHLRAERVALLELLEGLAPDQWNAPTVCPGWSVKDVALHLVDDDLGWLSRGRDQDLSGLLAGTPTTGSSWPRCMPRTTAG